MVQANGIQPQIHYRTCNLCEAMCGLEINVQGSEILSIKGDKADPFSQGHICPKATALADIYTDPDRLRHPVRRTADGWERIGWDEAFDEVVDNIKRIQKEHGRSAVGIYNGNPNVHNMGAMLYGGPFIRTLRTKNKFSATSVDQLPHHFASYFMFGHQLLLPVPDVDRTQFMLMLGANPLVSNGSMMTAGGIKRRLQALQKRGGKLVVIDPRRSETAVFANQHHFIKPGTDALFLLGLLHTIFDEGLDKLSELTTVSDGLETIRTIAADFPPEAVVNQTGIEAETIRQLAREFCGAETAVCYGRMGVSTQAFGGICQWLINLINLISGNMDSIGGAMFTLPALDVVGITSTTGQTGRNSRWHSRVRGLPEFGGELPVSVLAEEILTPGEDQIRMMITNAGNPVLSTPNGEQLDKAFASLDYMVAIDIYINETTRYANIILPPTTGVETAHYDLIFHVLAVRNTTKYSPPLMPAADDARHDWQILQTLRNRMDKRTFNRYSLQGKLDFFKRLPPHKILDLGLRFGAYGANGFNKFRLRKKKQQGLKLRTLTSNPHGVDLGPLRPILKERLKRLNGRINLAPDALVADIARLKQQLTLSATNGSLYLIGRRQLRSNNSWMHNSKRLMRGKTRCTILIHPQDAATRNIVDGQQVRVKSRVGSIQIKAEISNEVMQGVVSIPHGWGHHREGSQLSIAQAHPGVSVNDLTDDQQVDVLTGNAAFSGVPVHVQNI